MDSKKLAAAIRETKNEIGDIMDLDVPEIQAVREELRDAKGLLEVLAHIADGMSIGTAFGSPGDWGYGTAIGRALASPN